MLKVLFFVAGFGIIYSVIHSAVVFGNAPEALAVIAGLIAGLLAAKAA